MIPTGAIFRHYKNKLYQYQVLCVAKNINNSKDKLVVYSDYNKRIWARPQAMFLEKISLNNVLISRFEYIEFQEISLNKDIIIAKHTENELDMVFYHCLDNKWRFREPLFEK